MPTELNFTTHGRGGGRIPWVDKAGGQPWSEIAKSGFNLLPNDPNNELVSELTGSFLISDLFQLNGSQVLNVQATVATAGFRENCYNDVGFGILLMNGKEKYVLFALRPDNQSLFGDMGPTVPLSFAKPTQPGFNAITLTTPLTVVLGGVNYAEGIHANTPPTFVTSSCTPSAGEYQLLLGLFTASSTDPNQPSALIVWSAEVA